MSSLHVERIDAVPIAHVHDDIDVANAASTHEQLAAALGPDASSLVVDLSDARYLDSAGIDMLLRLSNRLSDRRAKLVLVIPDDSQLKRLATIVGLPHAVAIHPTVGEALQDATAPQSRLGEPHTDTEPGETAAGRHCD
jgi:anti-anti-sigma factor